MCTRNQALQSFLVFTVISRNLDHYWLHVLIRISFQSSATIFLCIECPITKHEGYVLTVCTTSSIDAWILDLGASYYMMYNRYQFDSFKKWNGTVKMVDVGMHSIKGNGIVYIKMHDCMVCKLDQQCVLVFGRN